MVKLISKKRASTSRIIILLFFMTFILMLTASMCEPPESPEVDVNFTVNEGGDGSDGEDGGHTAHQGAHQTGSMRRPS